ncbi:hypothetical protein G1C94_0629 [Bifidobacterium sp. DSM 109963]|uniref:Uncharacterized protein n=2 Tax=Bifidobacterium panos TaxID=2675321 RepID=A0ABX1SXU5_9BIFI|nr:hypothetical protein [Bifidobacterium sp. DSM 109963]
MDRSATMQLAHEIAMPDYVLDKFHEFELRGMYCADENPELDSLLRSLSDQTTSKQAREELVEWLKSAPVDNTEGLGMLYCMLTCAAQYSHPLYAREGIGDSVFIETMRDFTRFTCESLSRFGRYRFDRDFWMYHHLCLALFRLGTLEYEYAYDLSDIPAAFGAAPCMKLHIPSDASLSAQDIDRSLELRDAFLGRHFAQWLALPTTCESWMLDPSLKRMLPENSKILAFQQRFTLVGVEPSEDWREFVFNTNPLPVADLPERTSLQRNMKRHLLAGGSVGDGLGILR